MFDNEFKEKLIYPLAYNILSILGSLTKKIFDENELYILAYHRVLDLDENFKYYSDVINASTNDFKLQMKYISKTFDIISFNQLHDILKKGDKIDKDLLVITFDDAYKDFKINALPILRKLDLPATIFVTPFFADHSLIGWWEKIAYALKNTDKDTISIPELNIKDLDLKMLTDKDVKFIVEKIKFFDDKNKNRVINKIINNLNLNVDEREIGRELYLNWSELNELKKHKIEIGSHSLTHPILTKISDEQVKKEVIESKKVIEEKLNIKVNTFCYPNGRSTDFDKKIIKVLKDNGYLYSVTMMFGANKPNSISFDPYSLRRLIPVNYSYIEKQLKSTPVSNILNRLI